MTQVSKIEVVWRTHKQEVESEIKKMIREDGLELAPMQTFRYRTAAAKRVYDQMDEEKKQEIMQLVQEYKNKGNEPESQQQ